MALYRSISGTGCGATGWMIASIRRVLLSSAALSVHIRNISLSSRARCICNSPNSDTVVAFLRPIRPFNQGVNGSPVFSSKSIMSPPPSMPINLFAMPWHFGRAGGTGISTTSTSEVRRRIRAASSNTFAMGGRGSTIPSERRTPILSFGVDKGGDGPHVPGMQSSPNNSARGTISPITNPMSSTDRASGPATGCSPIRPLAGICPASCCPPYGRRPWLGLKP